MLEHLYRQASSQEIEYYHSRLYPLQDRVLEVVSVFGDALYLTGGTALARFHFQHRLSEDLDFFTSGGQVEQIANELIARLQEASYSIEVEQLSAWFVRFYVVWRGIRLKIDLVRDSHLTGDLTRTAQGFFTNSVLDIGANKVTAFEDRAEIKDIIDLHYIIQQHSLAALFALADQKRVPVAYEQLLTINQMGISGMALLTRPVDESVLESFVDQLRRAAEAEVKKKELQAEAAFIGVVADLLWDFPEEERRITERSSPVLRRRLPQLSLPRRRVLERALEMERR